MVDATRSFAIMATTPSVLETASGTGVVTRALRDALPASTERLRRQRGLSVGGARNVLTWIALGLCSASRRTVAQAP
jgi:hypothetical protein